MKSAAFAFLAVMLMVAQQGLAKNVTYSWQLGAPLNEAGTIVDLVKTPVCLDPGDYATFKWEDEGLPHNVYNTTQVKVDVLKVSDASNSVDCSTDDKFVKPEAPKDEPYRAVAGIYTVDAIKKGKSAYGIICTVGKHCSGGMKALIVVTAKAGDCAKRK